MKTRPSRLFKSLTGRLLAAAGLWTMLVLGVGGFVLSYAFASYVKDDTESRLMSLLDNVIGLAEVGTDEQLHFTRPLSDQNFDTPYSGWYWQINEVGKDAMRSRSLWDEDISTDMDKARFELMFRQDAGPDEQILTIAERDIVFPEAPERVFRFIIAADTATMRNAIYKFDRLLFWSLAIIALAIFASVIAQITYALKPIRSVRASLADVRKGLQSRVSDDLPDDLLPLSQEINALIDHNEKIIGRARTHVGNLAHALKTPLTVISNHAQESKDAKTREILTSSSEQMLTHINHHLQRARIAGGGTGKGVAIEPVIESLVSAMQRLFSDKNLTFNCNIDDGLMFDGESEDLNEIIGNLIDNASKWANAHIDISAHKIMDSPRRAMFTLTIDDDGVGVEEALREQLFERGKRLDERVPGTGLGLNIVREIAELYGGQASLKASPSGGLRAVLILPSKEL